MAARRPRPAFHSSPFFFVVFLLRTAAAAAAAGPQPAPSANAGGQICPAQTCGDLEIKFPLWLNNSDSGETICGHPRLLVDCENNDTAVLHTLYDSFLIAAVDYNKRLITLKDRDLQDDSCPRARHNFTLGSGFPLVPFDLGYILFFFNCSSEPEYSPEPSFPLLPLFPIPCLNNEIGKESYAAFVGNRTDVPWDKWHFCDGGHVQSPVMPPQEIYNLSTYFKNMLQKGFDLQFNLTANCGKCEEGSGICAFRNRSANYEFDCIYAARGMFPDLRSLFAHGF